jgi:rsbT co-antagonist protein RsbR
MGGQLGQLMFGTPADVPDVNRRDELGILANMVNRLARELTEVRRRDEARRAELERRVQELQSAYETQEKLFARVREFSPPILALHREILLVAFVGALGLRRVGDVLEPLEARIAARRAQVVIVDVSCVAPLNLRAGRALRHLDRSVRQHGASPVLSGVTSSTVRDLGVDLSPMTPCVDLEEALTRALDVVGHRITR